MIAGESRFSDVITTEAELREIMGYPGGLAARKTMYVLDDLARDYIARSPFLLIASADAAGNMDVSPKGDPPGFVHVLDNKTLLIPDRPGNRRADTFTNILQNPRIALLFLIPGKRETLRVSGRAQLIRDIHLREKMAVKGKVPQLLVAVNIDEVFFHCPKCIMRSELWETQSTSELADVKFLAEAVIRLGELDESVEKVDAMIDDESRKELY